jgi:hypothetical protein
MNSLFKEEWKNAMREELKSLLNNHTWKPIQQLPAYDSHAIGSRWVFKTVKVPDSKLTLQQKVMNK